jgi:NhaA family Na+:H+ antiporter
VRAPPPAVEHARRPWVAFVIVPVFALASAGVALRAEISAMVTDPIPIGIILGLCLGKPIGIRLSASPRAEHGRG